MLITFGDIIVTHKMVSRGTSRVPPYLLWKAVSEYVRAHSPLKYPIGLNKDSECKDANSL